MTDGSVVVDVNFNISQAEKKLAKLKQDIEKTEKSLSEKKERQSAIEAELKDAKNEARKTEKAIKRLNDKASELRLVRDMTGIKNPFGLSEIEEQIKEQQSILKSQEKESERIGKNYTKISDEVRKATDALDRQKDAAGELVQQIEAAEKAQSGMAGAIKQADVFMDRFARRVKGLAARALVFGLITSALRSLRGWLGKVIQTNSEARQSIARLKGALLTLAQPLVEVVIPAFTALVNILSSIVATVARFVSMLFGKTLKQSGEGAKKLYNEANAIGAVGAAADEAAGSLAGFDEINQISTETAKDAGGGSGSEIMPDFDFAPGKYMDMIHDLLVYLSGALLVIGAILLFSGANIPLGLGLMVLGASVLAGEITENWGAVDGKINEAVKRIFIILGVALLVLGAILAFSGANIPIGIGLMALGAAMLATSSYLNWGSTGEELRSALSTLFQIIGPMIAIIGIILAVTGHLLIGIGLIIAGISLFEVGNAAKKDGDFVENIRSRLTEALGIIGSLIAVVGVILLVTGHIILGLGLIIAGIALFEYSKVSDDNGKTTQEKILTVLKKTAEIVSVVIAVVGIILLITGHFLSGLTLLVAGIALFEYSKVADDNGMTMQEKIANVLNKTAKIAGSFLLVIGLILLIVPGMLPFALGLIAAGIVGIVSGIAPDWGFIQKKLGEMWAGVKKWWDQNVAKYLSLDWWKEKGVEVIDGFLGGLKNAWSGITSWFNSAWDTLFGNRKVSVDVAGSSNTGSFSTSGSSRIAAQSIPDIASYAIPRLAAGSVIPPNREFMAVLGDNKTETEVVSPLSTMKQAVLEALREAGGAGGGQSLHVNLVVDGKTLARVVVPQINDMTRQAGRPVLLY